MPRSVCARQFRPKGKTQAWTGMILCSSLRVNCSRTGCAPPGNRFQSFRQKCAGFPCFAYPLSAFVTFRASLALCSLAPPKSRRTCAGCPPAFDGPCLEKFTLEMLHHKAILDGTSLSDRFRTDIRDDTEAKPDAHQHHRIIPYHGIGLAR